MKSFYMRFKILVLVTDRDCFISRNIFPDLWNAETTLIVCPFFTIHSLDVSIDKNLFDPRLVRIFSLFIFFHVFKYLLAVDNKYPDVFIYLWCCQTHAIAGIHGLPHVINKLLKVGMIGKNDLADRSQNRVAVCY